METPIIKIDETTTTPSNIECFLTESYSNKDRRKVFFVASTGLCNLKCTYCVTGRPRLSSNLGKDDFSFIFNYFGENIYFIFSGIGDFFCGYSEKEQLLRFLLKHDIRILLDTNGLEIRELSDNDLDGKEKIDMIDISYHFGTMKNQGVLKKWVSSIRKIHENGYDYHIKMILSPPERDIWADGISFYRQEVLPITGKKLVISPDYLIDINSQLNELGNISAEYKDTIENLSQYGLFKQINFPNGKTPPCPAGNRYFRVLHSGDIMPCEHLGGHLNIRLGNIKQKNVAVLKNEVLCNYGGACDCGWTGLPKFGLLNDRNELYQRRFFHQFESLSQNCFTELPQETNNITYHFYRIGYDLPVLKNIVLEGRAYINDSSNIKNNYYVLLKSDNKSYIFNSFTHQNSDLISIVSVNKSDDFVFFAFIPYDAIEAGKYKIGIYIKNSSTEALKYTDEVLHKD